jgi:hypothetical protein
MVRPDASVTHGIGLRATAAIPAGTVIWFPCLNCPRWTVEQRALLPADVDERLDTWGHLLTDGTLLVPCSGAFMMNHSCAANVLDFGLDFGVAVIDIPAGAEITCDYGTFFADEGWTMRCWCGAPHCRVKVTSADYTRPDLRRQWANQLDAALPLVPAVTQPLGALLAAGSPTYRRVLAGSVTVSEAGTGDSIVRPGFQAVVS